jgi:hypothetical protein
MNLSVNYHFHEIHAIVSNANKVMPTTLITALTTDVKYQREALFVNGLYFDSEVAGSGNKRQKTKCNSMHAPPAIRERAKRKEGKEDAAARRHYTMVAFRFTSYSARNAMSGLMPPSVSTREASGTVMSAIRPRHPLRTHYTQDLLGMEEGDTRPKKKRRYNKNIIYRIKKDSL